MLPQKQLGFGLGLHGSLFDVLWPVFMIGIFVFVAAPVYQNYSTTVRVSKGLAAAAPAKAAVEKAFAATGPGNMSQLAGWSPPPPSEHLQSVAIANDGTITVSFKESVAPAGKNSVQLVPISGGKRLDLSVAASAGRKFDWQCGGAAGKTTLAEEHRPKECR